jgi:hypothetical protein
MTTRCYIPENSNLNNHLCENLKSYNIFDGHPNPLLECKTLIGKCLCIVQDTHYKYEVQIQGKRKVTEMYKRSIKAL